MNDWCTPVGRPVGLDCGAVLLVIPGPIDLSRGAQGCIVSRGVELAEGHAAVGQVGSGVHKLLVGLQMSTPTHCLPEHHMQEEGCRMPLQHASVFNKQSSHKAWHSRSFRT